MADFTMYSGDSKTLTIAIRDEAGDPVDVSTATSIIYAIVKTDGTRVATKTLGAGVTVATSTVTVTLVPADTAGLAGTYGHELEITLLSGAGSTALHGEMAIVRDYI